MVVITGYASVDTAKEAIRLGACDYLAKPLAPGEVIAAANSAMEQKHWTLHRERRRCPGCRRLARCGHAADPCYASKRRMHHEDAAQSAGRR